MTRDVANKVVANRVVGDVAGHTCLLIDDMIDTGGSITQAADLLFDNGATDVVIAATHGIFSPPATDRLKNSRVSEVIVTNTLPDPARAGLRQAHRSVDRADDRPGDQGGLRGRLGHQPLRRPQLSEPIAPEGSMYSRSAGAAAARVGRERVTQVLISTP